MSTLGCNTKITQSIAIIFHQILLSRYKNVNKSKRDIRLMSAANRILTNNTVGPDVKSTGNKSMKPVVTVVFSCFSFSFSHICHSALLVNTTKQNNDKKEKVRERQNF